VAKVIAEANAAGKGVSICGEMAGDPVFTSLLLGLGLRAFSMHPAQLNIVKQAILRADAERLAPIAQTVIESQDPRAAALQARLIS
jgi:phosphotransferase system enzyme I (PtsI)